MEKALPTTIRCGTVALVPRKYAPTVRNDSTAWLAGGDGEPIWPGRRAYLGADGERKWTTVGLASTQLPGLDAASRAVAPLKPAIDKSEHVSPAVVLRYTCRTPALIVLVRKQDPPMGGTASSRLISEPLFDYEAESRPAWPPCRSGGWHALSEETPLMASL